LDQSLWVTWYDLPVEGREEHLAWLHGSYIPMLLKKPGFVHAGHFAAADVAPQARLNQTRDPDVPTGHDFILIFGGENAHVFAHPAPHHLHAELPAADRKMLAMRKGERTSIFIEVARVDGPAAKLRESKYRFAPCVQVGSFLSGTADEQEILEFYAQGRMPDMSKLPGCIGMRKLISAAGWAKHGCLYEFADLASSRGFHGHEKGDPRMEVWTDTLIRKFVHGPLSPTVALRLWPPAK
jgi:hypothetical protein